MPPVHHTSGHQHVTSGEPWVREVSLLQRYPGHASETNEPAMQFASPPVPDTPQRGSSTVPRRLGRPYLRYVAPHQGALFFNAVSHLLTSYAVSVDGIQAIREPYPPRPPCTVHKHFASPGGKALLPSSVAHTPPTTVIPPPGMGERTLQMSSQSFSSVPPCKIALPNAPSRHLGCDDATMLSSA